MTVLLIILTSYLCISLWRVSHISYKLTETSTLGSFSYLDHTDEETGGSGRFRDFLKSHNLITGRAGTVSLINCHWLQLNKRQEVTSLPPGRKSMRLNPEASKYRFREKKQNQRGYWGSYNRESDYLGSWNLSVVPIKHRMEEKFVKSWHGLRSYKRDWSLRWMPPRDVHLNNV